MAEKQVVTCVRECWDSTIPRHYVRGDRDQVDPESPVAKYFEGWAPGTEVYFKNPSKAKFGKPEDGLKVAEPRHLPPPDEPTEPEDEGDEELICGECGFEAKSAAGLKTHEKVHEKAEVVEE